MYGISKTEALARADAALDAFQLTDFADRRCKTYSGGQRRRVDIALGIIHDPQIVFLDEPTTGLDPQSRAHLWDEVRRLRDEGTTVFLTTHYLDEADALCDRIAIIDRARSSPRARLTSSSSRSPVTSSAWAERIHPRGRGAGRPARYLRTEDEQADSLRLRSTRVPPRSRRSCGRWTVRTSSSTPSSCTDRASTTCSWPRPADPCATRDDMKLARDTWLLFQRQFSLVLRNPVWVIVGIIQPLYYLFLFGPLFKRRCRPPTR